MKKYRELLNDKVKKLNKYDIIIFILLVVFASIFSFYKLGNFKSPNTFYRFDSENIIIDLKKVTNINKIKVYNGELDTNYNLYFSNNNIDYELIRECESSGSFSWDMYDINYENVRYIKLEYITTASLGEIGIYTKDNIIKDTYITNESKMIKELNDEQSIIPENRSYMNSAYFDEVYFARTAYEYVYNLKIYEWTHPPLGKIIQAIPIYITKNMSPFNYRFMGCLAGVLLIGIMYIFGTVLFKKRKYGLYAALLMMLDTFRYAHTRMGTIDSHLVLFVTLSILFMYIFIETDKIRYLFLSGIFFSLSICIKWTGVYSGIALAIIYFTYLIKNKKLNVDMLIRGTIYFVFIPLYIYISIFYVFNNNVYKTNSATNIIKVNKLMYDYHSKLSDTHNFSSKWYTWPASYKPVWYHQQDTEIHYEESISGVGNIIIWYASILGMIYCLINAIQKKDKKSYILIVCFLSLWIPYIFITRIMYLYHFFPAIPFFFLGSLNLFIYLEEQFKLKRIIPIYLLLSLIFFIIYYPVISGTEIEDKYADSLEIYKSWYF